MYIIWVLLFSLLTNASEIKIRADLASQYCKRKTSGEKYVELQTNQGPIRLFIYPGQSSVFHGTANDDPADARRQNNFVHYVQLKDLSFGKILRGGIAFDSTPTPTEVEFSKRSAVLFDEVNLHGISYEKFLNDLFRAEQINLKKAIELFHSLHDLFISTLDACRSVPRKNEYATSDELDRILSGRMRAYSFAKNFNQGNSMAITIEKNDLGFTFGLYDPDKVEIVFGHKITFDHLNPLNFNIKVFSPEYFGKLPKTTCNIIYKDGREQFNSTIPHYLPFAEESAKDINQKIKSAFSNKALVDSVIKSIESRTQNTIKVYSGQMPWDFSYIDEFDWQNEQVSLKVCTPHSEAPKGKFCLTKSIKIRALIESSNTIFKSEDLVASVANDFDEIFSQSTHGRCNL